MAEIVLEKLVKRYADGFEAVKGADFTIEDGEFFILVGPSGCGKSTLLNMIVGLEDITDGHAHGRRQGRQRRRPQGPEHGDGVPELRHLSAHDRAGEHGVPAQDRQGARARRSPAGSTRPPSILELTEHLDRKPGNLSGGQRQRVAMGRAIVREPAAFLMDEPLSNLDAKLRVQMRTVIAKLQQRLGTTTIYVTHDQTEAMTLGDRVAVLRRGEVQQVGTPRELYNDPANLFVAGFIGSPAMNLLPAELDGDTLKLPMVDLDAARRGAGRASTRVPRGQARSSPASAPSTSRTPRWSSDPDAPGATFTTTIDVIEWMGAELFVHFSVEGSAHADLADLAEELETLDIGSGRRGRGRRPARHPQRGQGGHGARAVGRRPAGEAVRRRERRQPHPGSDRSLSPIGAGQGA